MAGFLQNLRRKSSETRKRIALGTSMAVTGLIFVMWLTVLNNGFINDADIQQLNTEATQTASPLSAFSENASSAFQQLKKSINSEEVSTTTSTSSDNSQQLEDDSSAYWSDHRQDSDNNGSVAGENNASQSASSNELRDNTEPFTSRNYNPSEESEWFSE